MCKLDHTVSAANLRDTSTIRAKCLDDVNSRMGALFLLILSITVAAPAHAHAPAVELASRGWLHHWSFEPWAVVLLVSSGALYTFGVRRLWRNAGAARGLSRGQVASFAAGWLSLVVALVSPLDALGDRLFSAHMVQHELLMIVAAPLLVVGRPLAAWAWAVPQPGLRAVGGWLRSPAWSALWRVLTNPLAAWTLHPLALWIWHVPAFFESALQNAGWHVLQHASFLITALLFWWTVLGRDQRSRTSAGLATIYLFTTMLHTGLLGALLTFASSPLYPAYLASAGTFGIDPLEDQQLGGLVMWVPGGLAYLAAGLAAAARLLSPPVARTGPTHSAPSP